MFVCMYVLRSGESTYATCMMYIVGQNSQTSLPCTTFHFQQLCDFYCISNRPRHMNGTFFIRETKLICNPLL